jgi:tetratricopeptide (TPR) repeat protein
MEETIPVSNKIWRLVILALLAGCASAPQAPSTGVSVERAPDYEDVAPAKPGGAVVETPAPPHSGPSPYAGLLARAETAVEQGQYEQALALLERAQRIDPDSGEIYLQLARTYDAKGDLSLARATAERGLLYCASKRQCGALRELAQ